MATIPSHSHSLAFDLPRSAQSLPRLEPGDFLSRAEFERRWEQTPSIKRAELIDGVVYMNAAVSVDHSRPHARIARWVMGYEEQALGTLCYLEPSVRLDDQNMPCPDVALCLEPRCGGQSRTSDDRYLVGPPELIVEVANSSVSYDMHQKLDVYRRHGVREYIVWRVYDQAIDWFCLVDGQYTPLAPDGDGILRSPNFAGLWLDPAALLRGDQARVLAVLGEGLASADHLTQVATWTGAKS
ncbi:MAG: Uma2 family endonuclease [Planctomycetaceae bacterium]|nr:Uma2 family endonuclease [Planctomycetaceae bacterium]